nr:uncharacterized protein LOC109744909 isoform X4 [Aegilops tauschii subsp. strangulata]XP_045090796.1 uncharacterized protein LOC109744909 isoform X4 [Aegilops tauschii subsp. strangulata]XP_045090797.1 uncharacterized protein LOC109744909 isoform X4 [Aegilops tauschii subsp. strangulata]
MIGALVAAQAAVQRSSSSMGKRAAENEQQYGQTSSSKRTTVWAEELHRRQGRSRRTGARAGEKEQQGLAQEIKEHAREIKEEACELLVHLIVEAGSGNAREELRPGGNATAHARGSRRMRVSSKRMRGSSKRTHASSRRTCREVPTTPAGMGRRSIPTLRKRTERYVISSDIAEYIVSEFDNQKLRLFKMEDVSMGMWVQKFDKTRQPVEYSHDVKFFQAGCFDGYYTAHY